MGGCYGHLRLVSRVVLFPGPHTPDVGRQRLRGGWGGTGCSLPDVFRRGVGNVYTQIACFVYTQIAGVEFCVYVADNRGNGSSW